jgi:transglutaminase-like putative cysteine protease
MDRRAMLESMHKFLRDENRYLVRNHYEPGDSSWAIDEALTMLSTGMGNCYNFAGAFWALGRGLGYNTVVYSGTISKNYNPHGWTEVILDGAPYICDPEIQKQYWAVQKYYDTFMLPYEMATGWQYEAPSRN